MTSFAQTNNPGKTGRNLEDSLRKEKDFQSITEWGKTKQETEFAKDAREIRQIFDSVQDRR
jgi:hypothetical protein